MPIRFNLRRDAARNWLAENPVLILQEPTIELLDNHTAMLWGNLPYIQGGITLDGGSASTTYAATEVMDGGGAGGG